MKYLLCNAWTWCIAAVWAAVVVVFAAVLGMAL